MGGGTLQLVIQGGQDIYITGNPEKSFFKSVYRRHTNFSIECIEQVMVGEITNKEFTINYTINKSGDLLSKLHFEIDLPSQNFINTTSGNYCYYNNTTAYNFLKNISFSIGEKVIDEHDGRFYDIMNELRRKDGDLDFLINRHIEIDSFEMIESPPNIKMFIPLDFWFCKDLSQSLPLVALQFHNVKLKATFRDIKHIINSENDGIRRTNENDYPTSVTSLNSDDLQNPKKADIRLWANYINLDVDERKRFAQEHHEYLIEQVQLVQKEYKPYIDLNLNHPVKCLYWVIQNDVALKERSDFKLIDNIKNSFGNPLLNEFSNQWLNSNDFLNYKTHQPVNPCYLKGQTSYDHFKTMKLTFNGIDRFKARDSSYFRTIQPLENGYTIPEKNVYMYSFCLHPENHQPSGSCNFSRIDNFSISFTGDQSYTGYKIYLYAKNYNVLRIMEGMGGLLYSN